MRATKEEIDRWVDTCRKPYTRDGKQPTRERVIVALADEVERLRKIWHIKRCDKWSNDGSQAADPSRRCRLALGHEVDCDFGELERLRAERVEVLALLAKLRALFPPMHPDVARHEDDDVCGKCGALVSLDDGCIADTGDPCHTCAAEAYLDARNLLGGAGHA